MTNFETNLKDELHEYEENEYVEVSKELKRKYEENEY